MRGKDLNVAVTDNSITLYWDKYEIEDMYFVYCGDTFGGCTEKTHFTIENLEEDKEYLLRVAVEDPQNIQLEKRVRTAKKKNRIDITKEPYLAKGDGATRNTNAIQKAFDDCTGEDVVYIPAGVFLTGALRLHSDMEVYLEEGAVLQGTDKVEDYLPRIHSRFEGIEMECYSSVLNMGELNHEDGYNCKNILIHGKGTIASGGRKLAEAFIESEREKLKDYLAELGDKVKECENENTIPGRVRPRLINMSNCQNIRLSGITFANGASWNVHMIYSDNIQTDHCIFRSEDVWNGDGWDPDSSTNCTIFACTFFTGDDSVAIKSGKNPEGNVINRPCKHIRIFDCSCAYGHGITIGSEMSGGIEDVKIWDCDLGNGLNGVEIKGTKKRGGYVRNIQVENCILPRILFHSVGYNDDGIAAEHPPVFEKCSFSNIKLLGKYMDKEKEKHPCPAIELCGFDVPGYEIRDIQFSDLKITETMDRQQLIVTSYCENVTFNRISFIPEE